MTIQAARDGLFQEVVDIENAVSLLFIVKLYL
jgi:hypothetical protein